MTGSDAIRGYRVFFALLTLVAIAYQWIDGSGKPGFSGANFFSFFTIQSNIIAAVVLLLLATAWQDERSPAITLVRGGAVAYMTTTGVVYGLLLSGYTEELGTVLPWVNNVVHRIIPLVMVIDWMIEQPRFRLDFRRCLIWMAYPFVYLAYTMIRGSIVEWYPYPFLDPAQSGGYPGVAAYVVGITIGFVGFVWLIVTLGNRPWQTVPAASAATS